MPLLPLLPLLILALARAQTSRFAVEHPPPVDAQCEQGDIEFQTVRVDGVDMVVLRRGPGCPDVEPRIPAVSRAVAQETTTPAATAAPEKHDTRTSISDTTTSISDTTTSISDTTTISDTRTTISDTITIGAEVDTTTGGWDDAAHAAQPAAVLAPSGDTGEPVAIIADDRAQRDDAAHAAQPAAVLAPSGDPGEPVAIAADGRAQREGRASSAGFLGPGRASATTSPPSAGLVPGLLLALGLVLLISTRLYDRSVHEQLMRKERAAAEAKQQQEEEEEEEEEQQEARQQEEALCNARQAVERTFTEEAVRRARSAAERQARKEAQRLASLEEADPEARASPRPSSSCSWSRRGDQEDRPDGEELPWAGRPFAPLALQQVKVREFTVGQRVRVRDHADEEWQYGEVTTVKPKLRVLVDGHTLYLTWEFVEAEEFKVVISKTAGQTLGLTFPDANGPTLEILAVSSGGLVRQWNEDHPDLVVKPGYRIVDVNGIRNDAVQMLDKFKRDKTLELVVTRSEDPGSPASPAGRGRGRGRDGRAEASPAARRDAQEDGRRRAPQPDLLRGLGLPAQRGQGRRGAAEWGSRAGDSASSPRR